MNQPTPDKPYRYDAFISYSHAADGKLSPAIQKGLSRFGRPWYSRSAVSIWRDETGLGLTLDIWGEIQERLEQSQCFILLASPEAAQSQWVEKEVRFWLEHRPGDPLLIVVTGGEISWRNDQMDFDWDHTTALPRSLQGVFRREPLWADYRWSKAGANLSLQSRPFFVEIAKLIAGMRRVPLEAVYSEADQQQRKQRRLLAAGATALALLALTALGAAYLSVQAKRAADRLAGEKQVELAKAQEELRGKETADAALRDQQRKDGISRRLAADSSAVLAEDRELSTLLAVEANSIARTPEAENALRQSLLELVPPLVLTAHSGAVYAARFSSDGKQVLTSGADRTVRLWNAATGSNLLTLKFTTGLGSGDRVIGLLSSNRATILTIVSPETLALGHWSNGSVRLYDASNGALLVELPDRYAVVADLSPDGTKIVTGGFDNAARVWDALTGKPRFELSGHEQSIAAAGFSQNGSWIVTGCWDGTARVWDSATGRKLATLDNSEGLDSASFNPDGSRVLTVSHAEGKTQELRLWDWANAPGSSLFLLAGHLRPIQDFAFSRDGKWLATASLDQTARIWETATGRGVHVLSKHDEFVNGVDFSPNGKWIVTASGDSTATIWEVATGQALTELGWNRFPRTCVAFSPDGKQLLTGTTGGAVPVYTYEICGSADDLVALAHNRVKRQLSDDERQKYVTRGQSILQSMLNQGKASAR